MEIEAARLMAGVEPYSRQPGESVGEVVRNSIIRPDQIPAANARYAELARLELRQARMRPGPPRSPQ